MKGKENQNASITGRYSGGRSEYRRRFRKVLPLRFAMANFGTMPPSCTALVASCFQQAFQPGYLVIGEICSRRCDVSGNLQLDFKFIPWLRCGVGMRVLVKMEGAGLLEFPAQLP